MKRRLCPQCKIPNFYVLNEKKERVKKPTPNSTMHRKVSPSKIATCRTYILFIRFMAFAFV